MTTAPAIAAVIQQYFPDWEQPADRHEWNKCRCPWHGDDRASASVSYEHAAFKCHGCGVKGDVIALIKREEGIAYGEAVRRAEDILGRSHIPVPGKSSRKRSRRVFGDTRSDGPEHRNGSRPLPPWLRR
ncbi:CHC2 zinc finger domain-containing protein [Amycolatopsis minnesotensis]|uniref:Zinc finger CHC2-type domain-containing protein n=1 Tax=Amycolatopsis minnesotensis TaxID=337894 RepID=A0ABP5BDP1_9PSEU